MADLVLEIHYLLTQGGIEYSITDVRLRNQGQRNRGARAI